MIFGMRIATQMPQHPGYLNASLYSPRCIGKKKKKPHFPGEVQFSWSSLFHSLNYLLGGRRRTFKLRRSVRFCLS